MKVTVVFVRVVTKPEYDHGFKRLIESCLKYKSGHDYAAVVINRYADASLRELNLEGNYHVRHMRYDGGGWDCGAWKFAGQNIDTDLLVCFNSSTYVTGDGWLKRFVDTVEQYGDGLYGPFGSYEVQPHIRTPCMIFQPHVINSYPYEVNSRDDTYRFEVFGFPPENRNFTQFTRDLGFKTMLVTWDGVYDLPDWRKPPNIFRRGDQSNLIVKDRHAEAYEVSDAEGKAKLEGLANG